MCVKCVSIARLLKTWSLSVFTFMYRPLAEFVNVFKIGLTLGAKDNLIKKNRRPTSKINFWIKQLTKLRHLVLLYNMFSVAQPDIRLFWYDIVFVIKKRSLHGIFSKTRALCYFLLSQNATAPKCKNNVFLKRLIIFEWRRRLIFCN